MKIKIGIIGLGPMASSHLDHLRSPMLKGKAEVVAAYDPSPTVQEKIKSQGLVAAESLEKLLNIPELNATFVTSPPQFHADQVVASLEAGKHVFSEVPMAIKKADVERIVAAEDRYPQLKYQYGENYCYQAEVLYAAKLAEMGTLGAMVYAESEYLHDVTYRWRQDAKGDPATPRVSSWYSLFDPLAYAHSIGPVQYALGGKHNPMEFIEAVSYANDIGGIEREGQLPICSPAHAFHVALFRSATGAIAKCANCYVIAREPNRLMIQAVGQLGTYECYTLGSPGWLFLADDHKIENKHRAGKSQRISSRVIAKTIEEGSLAFKGSHTLVVLDWLDAIIENRRPLLNAKVAANITMAGLAASEAARSGKSVSIPQYRSKA